MSSNQQVRAQTAHDCICLSRASARFLECVWWKAYAPTPRRVWSPHTGKGPLTERADKYYMSTTHMLVELLSRKKISRNKKICRDTLVGNSSFLLIRYRNGICCSDNLTVFSIEDCGEMPL